MISIIIINVKINVSNTFLKKKKINVFIVKLIKLYKKCYNIRIMIIKSIDEPSSFLIHLDSIPIPKISLCKEKNNS